MVFFQPQLSNDVAGYSGLVLQSAYKTPANFNDLTRGGDAAARASPEAPL
jgi:hypothetical protein